MKKKVGWSLFVAILVVIVAVSIIIFSYNISGPGMSTLYSKSCDELSELASVEFSKLNLNCQTDTNCKLIPVGCGVCVNRNSNTEKYEKIYTVRVDKDCVPTLECRAVVCECLDNKCETRPV